MYSIYADGVCVYDDVFAVESMKALNPKLTLEDNTAGSLTMTLTAANAGYRTITRLVTDISVQKDGEEIWAGRVLSEKKDFYNNRVLYCEGELAFFNDSSQPPAEYAGYSVRRFLETLIEKHNSKVAENRRFTIGAVTVHDGTYPTFYTNYEKTLELINNLVETYGGHIRVRKENGVRYLDYLAEYPDTCSQTIQFGRNLIDFTRQWDLTEFATVIVPLGHRLENSPIEALDAYLTVESVNDGSPYVKSDSAIAAYGWIEKTVSWNDVEDPAILLSKAQAYLSDLQFDNMVLEVSALDLHYLDANYEAVKLLDEIQVISLPHGLNRLFPVTKLEIPLDSPEKTQFKLGTSERSSFTSANNQTNAAILQRIENLPKAHSLLKEAKENATAIMNLATTGYITITKDAYGSETLYISNVRDYTKANKLWKWNMSGLGYSKDGGKTFGLAMTMDGAIVADFVTTGTMSADRIRTGLLESTNKNVIFDLDNGTLIMKKGSIQLGDYSGDSKHYQFEVDDEGHFYCGASGIFAGTLNAAKGSFGGQLVAATGNFKGIVQASDFLDASGQSMMKGSKFASDYLDLGNIKLNGVTGNIDMTGDINIGGNISFSGASSITWGNNKPVKYQFSVTGTGSWHDTMTSADMYRRDSTDGGKTWGSAYQFRGVDGANGEDGKDGKDGTDASVTRANIVRAMLENIAEDGLYTTTINGRQCLGINATAIRTGSLTSIDIEGVNIKGSRFYDANGRAYVIVGSELGGQGDFALYDDSNQSVFRIYAQTGTVEFSSYNRDWLRWDNSNKRVVAVGTWNFSSATVTGLTSTAVFG